MLRLLLLILFIKFSFGCHKVYIEYNWSLGEPPFDASINQNPASNLEIEVEQPVDRPPYPTPHPTHAPTQNITEIPEETAQPQVGGTAVGTTDASKECTIINSTYNGVELNKEASTTADKSCQEQCASTFGCAFWNQDKEGACHMLTNNQTTSSVSDGAVSGPKSCLGLLQCRKGWILGWGSEISSCYKIVNRTIVKQTDEQRVPLELTSSSPEPEEKTNITRRRPKRYTVDEKKLPCEKLSLRSHMLVIDSEEENNFISVMLNNYFKTQGTKARFDSAAVLIKYSNVSISVDDATSPNNNSDCVELKKQDATYKMKHVPCDGKQNLTICEEEFDTVIAGVDLSGLPISCFTTGPYVIFGKVNEKSVDADSGIDCQRKCQSYDDCKLFAHQHGGQCQLFAEGPEKVDISENFNQGTNQGTITYGPRSCQDLPENDTDTSDRIIHGKCLENTLEHTDYVDLHDRLYDLLILDNSTVDKRIMGDLKNSLKNIGHSGSGCIFDVINQLNTIVQNEELTIYKATLEELFESFKHFIPKSDVQRGSDSASPLPYLDLNDRPTPEEELPIAEEPVEEMPVEEVPIETPIPSPPAKLNPMKTRTTAATKGTQEEELDNQPIREEELPIEASIKTPLVNIQPKEAPIEEVPIEIPMETPLENIHQKEAPIEASIKTPLVNIQAKEAPIDEVPIEIPIETPPENIHLKEAPIESPIQAPKETPPENFHPMETPIENPPKHIHPMEVSKEIPPENIYPMETPIESPVQAPIEALEEGGHKPFNRQDFGEMDKDKEIDENTLKDIDGGWTSWGVCMCKDGDRIKTRSCTNPPPSQNGNMCSGASLKECDIFDPCAIEESINNGKDSNIECEVNNILKNTCNCQTMECEVGDKCIQGNCIRGEKEMDAGEGTKNSVCSEPFAVVGQCRAAQPYWSYNQKEYKCKEFIYGGCGGNGNKFGSYSKCVEVCKRVPASEQRQIHVPRPTPVDGKEIPIDKDSPFYKNNCRANNLHASDSFCQEECNTVKPDNRCERGFCICEVPAPPEYDIPPRHDHEEESGHEANEPDLSPPEYDIPPRHNHEEESGHEANEANEANEPDLSLPAYDIPPRHDHEEESGHEANEPYLSPPEHDIPPWYDHEEESGHGANEQDLSQLPYKVPKPKPSITNLQKPKTTPAIPPSSQWNTSIEEKERICKSPSGIEYFNGEQWDCSKQGREKFRCKCICKNIDGNDGRYICQIKEQSYMVPEPSSSDKMCITKYGIEYFDQETWICSKENGTRHSCKCICNSKRERNSCTVEETPVFTGGSCKTKQDLVYFEGEKWQTINMEGGTISNYCVCKRISGEEEMCKIEEERKESGKNKQEGEKFRPTIIRNQQTISHDNDKLENTCKSMKGLEYMEGEIWEELNKDGIKTKYICVCTNHNDESICNVSEEEIYDTNTNPPDKVNNTEMENFIYKQQPIRKWKYFEPLAIQRVRQQKKQQRTIQGPTNPIGRGIVENEINQNPKENRQQNVPYESDTSLYKETKFNRKNKATKQNEDFTHRDFEPNLSLKQQKVRNTYAPLEKFMPSVIDIENRKKENKRDKLPSEHIREKLPPLAVNYENILPVIDISKINDQKSDNLKERKELFANENENINPFGTHRKEKNLFNSLNSMYFKRKSLSSEEKHHKLIETKFTNINPKKPDIIPERLEQNFDISQDFDLSQGTDTNIPSKEKENLENKSINKEMYKSGINKLIENAINQSDIIEQYNLEEATIPAFKVQDDKKTIEYLPVHSKFDIQYIEP